MKSEARSRILGILILTLAAMVLLAAQISGNSAFMVQYDVAAKMRDGVTFYADIYPPTTDAKLPVLLMRTPYDKSRTWVTPLAHAAVSRGFVVVIQDVRGRYASEGEWYTFRNESKDGYDTPEWAA